VTSEYTATRLVDRARQLIRIVMRNAREKNKWRKVVKVRLWMPIALQMVLIGLVLFYTSLRTDGFINAANTTSVLIIAVPLAIAAMAQTHALLVGYLDLSVGAMISFGVVIASFLIVPESSNGEIFIGVATILLAGAGLGLINGALVRGVKIPSIIATLATLSILDGISLTLRNPPSGTIDPRFIGWLKTSWGPVPVIFVVVVLAAVVLDYWLQATRSGLIVRATGYDERSAKRSGVRTNWIRVRALLISGVLAAAASFFVMSRSPVGNAQIGSSFALNSITAAVLGGASFLGGRATFIGTMTASVLLALIITALPFLELTPDHGLMIIGVLVLLGIILFQVGDIKELVKRNFRRARRIVLGANVAVEAEIPELYPTGIDFAITPTGRKLIKGGIILSMDPSVGDLDGGDVLIEGEKILEIGRDLEVDGAEIIDASGKIVIPGFVDAHRHIWEGILRNIGTDVPLEGRTSYISFVLRTLAPAYRPEDVYAGNMVSAIGAIDAGVTTLLDWSHIQSSPAHTDAAISALQDSGLRAVFAYGFPWWGKWEERQPSWFVRAAAEHFSSKDQMLTLALAAPGPEFTDFEVARDHWKLARETDARITVHVGVGTYGLEGKVQRFGEARLLGSDTTYIHCTSLNDTEIQMIVDTGGTITIAFPVEMMMGHGMPPIQKFLDRGLAPSLSVDVETNVPSDMFNQMRSALALQRALAVENDRDPVTARDVLAWATIEGARANGLDSKTGTLTPGKRADVTILRTDRLNVTPLNDPYTAVVAGMDTGNVDTVLINGRVMKQAGELLHVDWGAVRRMVDESRNYVIDKSGFRLPKI
jgi:cytosine/adenosine deaminase-related metal-dependent hydrolase/ribose/xylose/arabinose/galactoside ABC-type transport system permease subunit